VAQYSTNSKVNNNYSCKNGILLWKNKVVVPLNSSLVQLILKEFHDSPVGGHLGIAKTVERICSQFYWPNMQRVIRDYVLCCPICQKANIEIQLPASLMHPLPIPLQVWEDICMDFITYLPPAQGYSVIVVVIDCLTKFTHFIALQRDFDSKSVAAAFIKNIVKMHGLPKLIVLDRDKIFISNFFATIIQIKGTNLAMSSAYHPEQMARWRLHLITTYFHSCVCYSLFMIIIFDLFDSLCLLFHVYMHLYD